MPSGQKPLFDLADWDDVSDDFKAAAKTACEKIFGETSVGLKTQYSVLGVEDASSDGDRTEDAP